MKFLKNNNAMTLPELMISVSLGAVIIIIVAFFITVSVEELAVSKIKSSSTNDFFIFRDKLNRYIKWWYFDFVLYWTGTNNTILLWNSDSSKGVLFWVVNDETKKIQNDYIYGDNYIWYKELSQFEMDEIKTNSWKIYDYDFKGDKIFHFMLIKDFKATLYNRWDILDLDISIINKQDKNDYWKNFSEINFDWTNVSEFNLIF